MKITFVSPYYHNIWESLGVAYVASYVAIRSIGNLDIQFLHGNFDSDIVQKCCDSDIVAFSCTTPTFADGLQMATKIKEINKNVYIVFGGWHVTAIGENRWSDTIDSIVIGEGEDGFNKIINEGCRDKEVYSKMLDFDKLEWPNRHLVNQDLTLNLCEDICGERIASFQSRRGCPMNCKICSESCMTENAPVRVRDPLDLLNEINYVNAHFRITKFKFLDPTWCYPKSAVYDFCETKIRLKNSLRWEGMVHAAFLDKDLLKVMKEAGCHQINVGVESGSQKILNDINKGVTVSKIKKVFKWGHDLGLDMRAFFILGTPNETWETLKETEQLAEDISPDVLGFTILCPYPGSDYYDEEKYKDIDWSRADEYSNDFWSTTNFSNEELKAIQQKFIDKFDKKINWHQKIIGDI